MTKINRQQTDFAEINDIESALIDMQPRPWGVIMANGQATVMQAVAGMTQRAIDLASAAGFDAAGVHLRQDTTAVLNTEVFVSNAAGSGVTRPNFKPKLLFKAGLGQTTNERAFMGLVGSVAPDGAPVSSDTPAAQYVGIQYSTSRGDVNWQFVTHDGTTQGIVNSGVAASNATLHLRMTFAPVGTNILLEILDADFVLLASHTFTANQPSPTTELVVFSGLRNLAALAVKSMRQYFVNLVNGV